MKKAVLVCLVMLVAVSFAAVASGEKGKLPEGQAQVQLAITGMTCGACCAKVETAAKALPGVVDATADYKAGTATITYDKAKVDVGKIVATINEKTSFKASEKKA